MQDNMLRIRQTALTCYMSLLRPKTRKEHTMPASVLYREAQGGPKLPSAELIVTLLVTCRLSAMESADEQGVSAHQAHHRHLQGQVFPSLCAGAVRCNPIPEDPCAPYQP